MGQFLCGSVGHGSLPWPTVYSATRRCVTLSVNRWKYCQLNKYSLAHIVDSWSSSETAPLKIYKYFYYHTVAIFWHNFTYSIEFTVLLTLPVSNGERLCNRTVSVCTSVCLSHRSIAAATCSLLIYGFICFKLSGQRVPNFATLRVVVECREIKTACVTSCIQMNLPQAPTEKVNIYKMRHSECYLNLLLWPMKRWTLIRYS